MGSKQWFAVGCCWLLPVLIASGQEPPLRFGVFPFTSPNVLERRVGPLVGAMSEHLNRPISFRTRNSFDDFLQALQNQSFDIALIQPFDYVLIQDSTDYLPLVKKSELLRANLVSADPKIKSLQDLRHQVVAFPSHRAAVTLLALRELQSAGLSITDFEPRFFNEHTSCLLAARNGLAKACATVLSSSQDSALHTVNISAGVAHILIVARPGVVDSEDLQRWLLSLNEQASGQSLLANAYLDQVNIAADADFDRVKAIYQEIREANDYIDDNYMTHSP
jgi:phosphonate transport system substrate-binding protein